MIAKVTAPPFSALNDTQKLVVTSLRGKSKTSKQLAEELKRNYHVIQRALNDLKGMGWVEIDPLMSGGRSNSWKLKKVPSDSIEIVVDTGLDQQSISFNRWFESIAKQLNGGRQPKLARELEDYFKAIAKLGYYAALEFTKPESINETLLLEARATIQSFNQALQDAYSVSQQILEDERFWHATTLVDGIIRKTDRYLTPADLARYAQMITESFNPGESPTDDSPNEFDSEEETDSADD